MMKDTLERAREPNLNLKDYLREAYIHPVYKAGDDDVAETDGGSEDGRLQEPELVPTKRHSRRQTPKSSICSDAPLLNQAVSSLETSNSL